MSPHKQKNTLNSQSSWGKDLLNFFLNFAIAIYWLWHSFYKKLKSCLGKTNNKRIKQENDTHNINPRGNHHD